MTNSNLKTRAEGAEETNLAANSAKLVLNYVKNDLIGAKLQKFNVRDLGVCNVLQDMTF